MSARDEVLARIRGALADVPAAERPSDVAVDRSYRHEDPRPREELVALLCARIADYGAEVRRPADDSEVAGALAEACRAAGLRRVVVPPALAAAWRPDGVELLEDDGRPGRELDGLDGAITGCAVAIAETGTLVLDCGAVSGRRALTLVPDHHLCVVRAEEVVGIVPEALARVRDAAAGPQRRPITFVSGPSASSDIELERVEGVHGPRHLVVLVVG